MARQRSNPRPQGKRKWSRMGSVEAEEFWRTGRKRPGSGLRAFGRMYPSPGKKLSEQLGPVLEEGEGKV